MNIAEHFWRVRRLPLGTCPKSFAFVPLLLSLGLPCRSISRDAAAQETAPAPTIAAKTSAPLGTIKSISGNSLILTSDAGADVNVDVRDSTKIVRIAPGQKDLKDAQTIALMDLQVGDRILVRGQAGDAKTFVATSIIAMKKADIADKQSRERDEWQKSGVGGLVNSVDVTGGVISITVPSLREKKNVAVRVSNQTILRRYAPGSVKFDDAKPASLEEIRPGDQLRARGEKNSDGSELAASEVVSGSFRNVSGTISSLDVAQGMITVHDLATKKAVTVKITSESQLRKLPAPIAQRIAQRLNGASANGEQPATGAGLSSAPNAPTAKEPAQGAGQVSAPAATAEGRTRDFGGRGRGMGAGAGGAGGAMDLQQMISRMPASTIVDLQKGDAVMLVATEGSANAVTAITLLAGVEPILQGSPSSEASSILSPWSLSAAPSGEAGTP
jgi:co-chaperonin GroES (HSP10)